jgi:hypothetical protein
VSTGRRSDENADPNNENADPNNENVDPNNENTDPSSSTGLRWLYSSGRPPATAGGPDSQPISLVRFLMSVCSYWSI